MSLKICILYIYAFRICKDENSVSTFMIPLDGKENSFSYKSDSCEYIISSATGKKEKQKSRWYPSCGN